MTSAGKPAGGQAAAYAPDPPDVPADAGWRRLDPRMLAVFPLKVAGGLVPLLVVLIIGGRGAGGWQLFGALGTPALLVVLSVVRWYTVRYRVGAERVELRSGLLARQQRSLRRDRVRTVDLHASPVHRLFGLSVVEIGTGSTAAKEGRLSLDAVTAAEAERLRRELLDRSTGPATPAAPTTATTETTATTATTATTTTATTRAADRADGVTVAQLDPAWLRFAPLTTSGLVAVGAVVGTAFKVAGDAGVNLVDAVAVVVGAGGPLRGTPLWLGITLLSATVLVIAALGSLAVYLEGWWRYRLSREADGTLRLRRGLLTTRSLSIEQRRMRGAEVSEPLPLRLVSGARCAAITTGLDARTSSGGALLPPAPRAEAHRVAAAALVLRDPANATGAALVRHPPAAARRRLTRAVLPAVAFVLVLWWLRVEVPALDAAWPAVILAVPLAALIGADRYRNLGHALCREFLVIGSGSLVRRRVALARRGIIGWRVRQSPLQRWAGVVTLDAVTAAGAGRYSIVDVSPARAVELIELVNPALSTSGSRVTQGVADR